MRRRLLYCLMIMVVCLSSCGKREQVIPRKTMAKIYAEMFIADQQIAVQSGVVRKMADTSFVYEPIFEKYGYTSDDFRASMAYYIKDANRYARILKNTGSIIEGEIKDLKKQLKEEEMRGDAGWFVKRFIPEKIYYLTALRNSKLIVRGGMAFAVDSTGGDPLFNYAEWDPPGFNGPEVILGAAARRSSSRTSSAPKPGDPFATGAMTTGNSGAANSDNSPAESGGEGGKRRSRRSGNVKAEDAMTATPAGTSVATTIAAGSAEQPGPAGAAINAGQNVAGAAPADTMRTWRLQSFPPVCLENGTVTGPARATSRRGRRNTRRTPAGNN